MQSPIPVTCEYYSTGDIRAILGCGRGYAERLARMFEQQGQAMRKGRTYLISKAVFDAWRREEDGTAAMYKAPLRALAGGKADAAPSRTRAARLEEENRQLKARIDELTRPKKRGRPPKKKEAAL